MFSWIKATLAIYKNLCGTYSTIQINEEITLRALFRAPAPFLLPSRQLQSQSRRQAASSARPWGLQPKPVFAFASWFTLAAYITHYAIKIDAKAHLSHLDGSLDQDVKQWQQQHRQVVFIAAKGLRASDNAAVKRCKDEDLIALDVTALAEQHPGGADVLKRAHGHDATRVFSEAGHLTSELFKQLINSGVVRVIGYCKERPEFQPTTLDQAQWQQLGRGGQVPEQRRRFADIKDIVITREDADQQRFTRSGGTYSFSDETTTIDYQRPSGEHVALDPATLPVHPQLLVRMCAGAFRAWAMAAATEDTPVNGIAWDDRATALLPVSGIRLQDTSVGEDLKALSADARERSVIEVTSADGRTLLLDANDPDIQLFQVDGERHPLQSNTLIGSPGQYGCRTAQAPTSIRLITYTEDEINAKQREYDLSDPMQAKCANAALKPYIRRDYAGSPPSLVADIALVSFFTFGVKQQDQLTFEGTVIHPNGKVDRIDIQRGDRTIASVPWNHGKSTGNARLSSPHARGEMKCTEDQTYCRFLVTLVGATTGDYHCRAYGRGKNGQPISQKTDYQPDPRGLANSGPFPWIVDAVSVRPAVSVSRG